MILIVITGTPRNLQEPIGQSWRPLCQPFSHKPETPGPQFPHYTKVLGENGPPNRHYCTLRCKPPASAQPGGHNRTTGHGSCLPGGLQDVPRDARPQPGATAEAATAGAPGPRGGREGTMGGSSAGGPPPPSNPLRRRPPRARRLRTLPSARTPRAALPLS